MVSAWRRAFCTAIPKDQETKIATEPKTPSTPRAFTFFSNPSTPRPSLRCRTTSSVDTISTTSTAPNSPQSKSSTFSLLKNTLRLSKNVKSGDETPIFTSECSHRFHHPCVTAHVKRHRLNLTCPVCNAHWHHQPSPPPQTPKTPSSYKDHLKVYNDDEPLTSPTTNRTSFIPIPEESEDEFPGFITAVDTKLTKSNKSENEFSGFISINILPESAIISSSKSHETRVLILRVKTDISKTTTFRFPVDLVLVADVSDRMSSNKLENMIRAMKVVISCLDSRDRLSIVAFSACSKRLMNLRRMTSSGKRSARRIVDVIGCSAGRGKMSVNDAVRKAAKVLEDRKERNPVSMVFVFSSDGGESNTSEESSNRHRPCFSLSSSRVSYSSFPVHAFGFEDSRACNEDVLVKCVGDLLLVTKDVRIRVGFNSGEVSAAYSGHGKPEYLGSDLIKLGDFHSDEEKELLLELKVPTRGSHRMLTVKCSYDDFSSREIVRCTERVFQLPRIQAVRSFKIERLRCRFVYTRAVAECKRLMERKDYSGGSRLLTSARALLVQTGLSSGDEYLRGLEAELAELNWRRQQRSLEVEEKVELLTPTSAWRAAERLAKVAMMRKSLNRVSDLHGFENARF